jgi:large subunit ribosomal protein L30
MASLRVTQVKSGIGTKPKHRGTLRALGLHGIGSSNDLPDRPEIRGMIARVPHLVRVQETAAGGAGVPAQPDARVSGEAPTAGRPAGNVTEETS